MYEISMNINKELDISSIKHLLVKGESLADNIKIKVPRTYEGMDLKDKIFTIKTQNSSGVYYEKVLTKTVEDSTITLSWVVTRAFTGSPGSLKLTLHISDNSGYSLATKANEVNVAHSIFIATPIGPMDVLEDYLQEIRICSESASNSAEQSLKILKDMNSKIVDDFTSTAKDKALSANKGRELNTRVENLVGQTGTSNTEIVDARNSPDRNTIYPTLKARLDAVDGDIVKSKYSAPTVATAPIISLPSTAVKGKMEGSLKGNTLYQAVVNGDFANGTSGWSVTGGTLNVTNGIAMLLANSSGGRIFRTNQFFKANNKFFIFALVKATSNQVILVDPVGGTLKTHSGSNNYELLSGIYQPTSDINGNAQCVRDNRTSGWDNTLIDFTGVVPITGTPYENWTADQLNNLINGYWEGLGNSKSNRTKVIGKNLFDVNSKKIDKGFPLNANYVSENLVRSYSNDSFVRGYKYFLKLKPNTSYTIKLKSTLGGNASGVYHVIQNTTSNSIITILNIVGISNKTFTTPSDGLIDVTFARSGGANDTSGWVDVSDIQLNEGATPLPYEPYQETELFCPIGLGSVSGVQDEFSFDGKNIQRTKEYTLQTGDVSSFIDTFSNVDVIGLNKRVDEFSYGTVTSSIEIAKTINFPNFRAGVYADSVSNIGVIYNAAANKWGLIVPKGTYTNLAAAQTALTGTKIRYQLATPIETQYPASNLIAEPSGTIYLDSAIKVVKPYTTNITLDVKIKNLTSVTKVDGETRSPILLSLVNIAADGMSLAILNASSGDMYELEYEIVGATLPTIQYSYPLNLNAQVQGNTDQLKSVDKTLQDFINYQKVANLQLDLRIALLEGGH